MNQHTPPARRLPRLTAADYDVINTALALLEAEHEGEEPYTEDPDEFDETAYADWQTQLDRIRAVRLKVHARR